MVTPLRRQYLKVKQKYPEAIVLFRLGDFYETFDEDARIASRELDIVLTGREMGKGQRVPMAGLPYHALDNYLGKLISRGYKVAICEQLTDPDASKGLVERDVIRVVTPGTVIEPGLLQGKVNNYLVGLVVDKGQAGIAHADITTGEFATTQLPADQALFQIERLKPSELLAPEGMDFAVPGELTVTRRDDLWFDLEEARELLLRHFGAATLEAFGCAHLPLAVRAAGAVLRYVADTQKAALGQVTRLSTYSAGDFMTLDGQTQRNLELFQNSRSGTLASSLLSVIDLTKTAMGGRLLRRWLGQPLLSREALERRLDAVQWFYENALARNQVASFLNGVADLERLVNRVKGGMALPREVVALRRALEVAPEVKSAMGGSEQGQDTGPVAWLNSELKPCEDIVFLIAQAIREEPASNLDEGGVIRDGFSEELDALRQSSRNARQFLADLERDERERTGIKSLKVGYNRVFGYYIEVSKPNLAQVPPHYIRKQTLVGAERFYTPELKEYESQVLNAEERIVELEAGLFRQVCQQIGAQAERLLATAHALAQVDVFGGLAEAAVRYRYVRPELADDGVLSITGGRHPVVERSLPEGSFVPNDTLLSNEEAQLIILTGPNMAGKSTYLRQVALIVLMAQTGSFVPAESAAVGMIDRIFTRIGAQEDLAAGQSTFMVEMVESANILHNATSRSLIILDEIGRGTSTYDGLSIARAVAEYIHNHPRLGAKTLFATHYHELVELAGYLPRVRNFNVAVTEEEGKVIFLRKVIPGGADRSYGIHVAQLAGLPRSVIRRAEEVLVELEGDSRARHAVPLRR
ncbi:MAG: mutS, partial [Dehalococcoidia bacterium]|nr:mutS [Dehalococcoidia bacterium]